MGQFPADPPNAEVDSRFSLDLSRKADCVQKLPLLQRRKEADEWSQITAICGFQSLDVVPAFGVADDEGQPVCLNEH